MKTRTLTLALGVATAAIPTAAHADPGMTIGMAHQCPGLQPWSTNQPTPTCVVAGAPLTLVNLTPRVVQRHPAYGWQGPTCLYVGASWTSHWGHGTITAGARVVEDNGSCTGPNVPMDVYVDVVPRFANVYGVPAAYFGVCNQMAAGTVAAVAHTQNLLCGGRTYRWTSGDYERGEYSLDLRVHTSNQTWGGSVQGRLV